MPQSPSDADYERRNPTLNVLSRHATSLYVTASSSGSLEISSMAWDVIKSLGGAPT